MTLPVQTFQVTCFRMHFDFVLLYFVFLNLIGVSLKIIEYVQDAGESKYAANCFISSYLPFWWSASEHLALFQKPFFFIYLRRFTLYKECPYMNQDSNFWNSPMVEYFLYHVTVYSLDQFYRLNIRDYLLKIVLEPCCLLWPILFQIPSLI